MVSSLDLAGSMFLVIVEQEVNRQRRRGIGKKDVNWDVGCLSIILREYVFFCTS